MCVVAKGIGSTHLAPATIDVLGYTLSESRSRGSPWRSSSPTVPTIPMRCSAEPAASAGIAGEVAW